MADITMSQVTELEDQNLRAVAKRVFLEVRLAAEKAVAHHAKPTNYPIAADPNSLEQIFLTRFKQLRVEKQQAAKARVLSFVKAPKVARTGVYGDLAKVNLRNATSVEAQVKALAFPAGLKFQISHLQNLKLHGGIVPIVPGGGFIPQQTTNKLELRIHKVKCIDETGGWPEWGEDEIYLGGTTVDESGDTKKVAQFKVSDFDDGDVKNYSPPKQFTWFSLLEGTEWPKSYFVTLVLAEVDMGGLADFLNKLLDKVKAEVISALAAAIGGAIGASGGPIGAAIGAVVGWVVGQVFEWLKSWWSDDIFKPFTVSVSIPSLNARWAGKTDSPEYWVKWWGHDGTYQLWYDWRLFA